MVHCVSITPACNPISGECCIHENSQIVSLKLAFEEFLEILEMLKGGPARFLALAVPSPHRLRFLHNLQSELLSSHALRLSSLVLSAVKHPAPRFSALLLFYSRSLMMTRGQATSIIISGQPLPLFSICSIWDISRAFFRVTSISGPWN